MSAPTLTQEERDARRQERIDAAEQQLAALESEEGFRLWIQSRRFTHTFSFTNQALIAIQADILGIEPDRVQAAWRWKRAGYHPAKGSKAMFIWVYASRRRKGDNKWTCCGKPRVEAKCPECGKPDHYFKMGPVFAASQVVSFEGGTPPPPAPEVSRVDGNDLAHLTPRLVAWLKDESIVDTIDLGVVSSNGEGGYWKPSSREIVICHDKGSNEELATLIHEAAHAAGGVDYELFERGEAELIVELVALCVCSAVGLDISGRSIPYVAGWAKGESRELLRKRLSLINQLASRIEGALDLKEES